jgi:thioredoxin-like negative regulator of GroEL
VIELSRIIDLQVNDWAEKVEQEERPVVVEYWHHKCVVCVEMKPIFEVQPQKYDNSVVFARINLLESKENRVFAIKNGVRSTPTFIVYCVGRPIGQIIGRRGPEEFTEELKMIIDNAGNCLKATPLKE